MSGLNTRAPGFWKLPCSPMVRRYINSGVMNMVATFRPTHTPCSYTEPLGACRSLRTKRTVQMGPHTISHYNPIIVNMDHTLAAIVGPEAPLQGVRFINSRSLGG